jgi:hypothetical protein
MTTFEASDYTKDLSFQQLRERAKKFNSLTNTPDPIPTTGKGVTKEYLRSTITLLFSSFEESLFRQLQVNPELVDNDDFTDMCETLGFTNLLTLNTAEEEKTEEPCIAPAHRQGTHKYKYVSPYSPQIQDRVSRVGFIDQNGSSYFGDIAVSLFQALWDLPESSNLRVPESIRLSGSFYGATIIVDTNKKEVETKEGSVFRPIDIRVNKTLVKANKVTAQGFNTTLRRQDLKPLFQNGRVLVENILQVIWYSADHENIKTSFRERQSTYRKAQVKTRISWGTKFIPDGIWGNNKDWSIPVSLPGKTANDKSIPARIALNSNGKVTLYDKVHDTKLMDIGTFRSTWNIKTSTWLVKFDIDRVLNTKPALVLWKNAIEEKLIAFLEAASKSNSERQDESLLARQYAKIADANFCLQDRRLRKKYKNAAMKAVQKMLNKGRLVPIDVERQFRKIQEDKLSSQTLLTNDQRNYAYRIILGYFLAEIKGENIYAVLKATKPKVPKAWRNLKNRARR